MWKWSAFLHCGFSILAINQDHIIYFESYFQDHKYFQRWHYCINYKKRKAKSESGFSVRELFEIRESWFKSGLFRKLVPQFYSKQILQKRTFTMFILLDVKKEMRLSPSSLKSLWLSYFLVCRIEFQNSN